MGLLGDILSDVGAEATRLTAQGAAELSAALFSSSDAFVQYGTGQDISNFQGNETPQVEAPAVEPQQIEQPSQGMEM